MVAWISNSLFSFEPHFHLHIGRSRENKAVATISYEDETLIPSFSRGDQDLIRSNKELCPILTPDP